MILDMLDGLVLEADGALDELMVKNPDMSLKELVGSDRENKWIRYTSQYINEIIESRGE